MRITQVVSLFLAAALAACTPSSGHEAHGPGAGRPPPEVSVVTVTPHAVPVSFEYVGQTAGSREVEVRARVTGILLSHNFKEGAAVKAGQSLFTIDPEPYKAALARAEADLAAARARREQARRDAARLKPLYAEKAVSQKQYDDAVSAAEIAAADAEAARARLAQARLDLGYTKVVAPISGVAGRALKSDGSLVSGPDVLLTRVVQVDPIWVNFGIPDSDRERLRKEVASGRVELPGGGGMEVALRLADGTVYPHVGQVDFSDVRISPATGTQEARAELPNARGTLRPGQFVRVILKGATLAQAVTVPQRAVLEGPQGKFVYVVDAKDRAEVRPVEVGEWSGESWIITGGLKSGERVIVDGVMKLGPGAPVTIARKPPAVNTASRD
jgi:membrane fusion protein (multidrug efflux system)